MSADDSANGRRDFLRGAAILASLGPLMDTLSAQESAPESAAASAAPAQPPTVLITGANRGIGLEFARRYAALGYRVIATCRKPDAAPELQALAGKHPQFSVETLDVLDHAGIDALAQKLAGQPIDILLNNAGIPGNTRGQMFGKLDYPDFNEVMAVNAVGPIKVCEAFVKHVQVSAQKKMITVSSGQGSIGEVNAPRTYWYRASKSAVNMLMANLALQVKSRGIVIGLVTPGATDTDFMKGLPKSMLRPVADAVTDMLREIERMDITRTGAFVDTRGNTIPW